MFKAYTLTQLISVWSMDIFGHHSLKGFSQIQPVNTTTFTGKGDIELELCTMFLLTDFYHGAFEFFFLLLPVRSFSFRTGRCGTKRGWIEYVTF